MKINNTLQSLIRDQCKSSVIFTVCSVNYLKKAVALGLSVLDHHPDIDFVILVADSYRSVEISDTRICLFWAEHLGFPAYFQCAFKYNIIEFNTALKPFAALHLLKSYEQVIYLDPDICVYSSLTSVFAGLDEFSAVFTPHALSSYDGQGRPNDRDLLRFGSNNLGFFAVRRTESAERMLLWWHDRCQSDCYYEPQLGLGVDQKWIDLVFSFFDGMGLLKDPGLNVAFWNLHERQLSCAAGSWRVNVNYRLGFIHFSSFVEMDDQVIADKQTRHAPGSRPDFSQVASIYRDYLRQAKGLVNIYDTSYSYGQFDNGDAISAVLRRFYAISDLNEIYGAENPFEAGGRVYRFAKNNGLISVRPVATTHVNFKVQADYSIQRRVIAVAFRFALHLLGPDRYFNLMRYLAHYSSLLNQQDLLRK